jgi:exopolyphosphatase/guanosine-5'-triphosphate,3'-diphosphate pyrophosphatase
LAVACGGNAEALALIAPGKPQFGFNTLDLRVLRRKLHQIAALNIKDRMNTFAVRKDRAEVMGIAAIVLATLGRWAGVESLLVPGVGVKEGILIDLLRSSSGGARHHENALEAEVLLASARRYGLRLNWDSKHAEKVRQLAVSLFDQLRPVHKMGPQMRVVLEMAALLHDIGRVIRHGLHYQHGEYMVRNGNIAGLEGSRRAMVACLVYYHSETEPDEDPKIFLSFPRKQQAQILALVSLLRIADALDWDHRQPVVDVQARLRSGVVTINLRLKHNPDLILWAARRRAKLFETNFDCHVEFKEIG